MSRTITMLEEQTGQKGSSKKKKDFELEVLLPAVLQTIGINGDIGLFEKIRKRINGGKVDPTTGAMKVQLTCQINRTTGDVIEDAIRVLVGDEKGKPGRKANVDVMFDGTPIEVKSTETPAFQKLASDSQSLRRRTDKWYMYVRGPVTIGQSCTYNVWLMRSDAFFDAVKVFRNISDEEIINSPTIEEIEAMIDDKVRRSLAIAIWNKTNDVKEPARTDKGKRPSMGLEKKIGLNRVRFDIKFESLLRAYVKEILRS